MLADENQVLCMEDLNAKGMMKNHHLAKAVTDASFGEFAHTDGGETHPLQHGRYRGARGNRGGYNRLNARGEDIRP